MKGLLKMKQYTFDPYKITELESKQASDIINRLNDKRIKKALTYKERQFSLIEMLREKGFNRSKTFEIFTNIDLEERNV